VTNAGPAQASDIVITDIVPNGLTYVPGTITGADSSNEADPSGAGLVFNIDILNRSSSRVITFDATTDDNSNLLNPIRNTAGLTSVVQTDIDPANNSGFVDIDVNDELDLEIVKTVDNATPLETVETVTYTLTVRNNGPAAASNVIINDLLDAGLIYVGGSMTQGAGIVGNNPASAPGANLTWNIDTILRNQVVVLTFQVTAASGTSGQTITNTGVITALDQPDLVPANNTSSVNIRVRDDMDLQVLNATVTDNVPSETDVITHLQ
jgi:uncharacterized repeat protein (TIGR01451 family)